MFFYFAESLDFKNKIQYIHFINEIMLYKLNLYLMKIVISTDGKIYSLAENQLTLFGQYETLKTINAPGIITIGNDIYFQTGDKLKLIENNAEAFDIIDDASCVENQFNSIKDNLKLLKTPDSSTDGLATNACVTCFDKIASADAVFVAKSLQTKEFTVFEKDSDGNIVKSAQPTASGEDAFFWNGRLYSFQTSNFKKVLVDLLAVKNNYIVFKALSPQNTIFAVDNMGNITLLGNFLSVEYTAKSEILSTTDKRGYTLWHLHNDFFEKITSILDDENFEVSEDGSITYYRLVDNSIGDDDHITFETLIYKLSSDGHYIKK